MVAEGGDPSLFSKEVNLGNINIIAPLHSPIRANWRMKILVRVRYRQPLVKATLQLFNSQTHKLIFEMPQKAVAPGQSAVFYTKTGEMLGGGVIMQ